MTRRDLLRWIGAASLLRAVGGGDRAVASVGGGTAPLRYFLLVYLGGGIDQILTTDPKTRSQIEPYVDRPYRDSDIISEGGLHLGPILKPLRRHAGQLTIVNGVLTATVSHQTGALQHTRLKIGSDLEMPSIVDLIGLHREGQALPSVTLGDVDEYTYTSTGFGSGNRPGQPGLLDQLGELSNDELLALASEAEQSGRNFARDRGLRSRIAVDNMSATAALFRRLAEVPRFVPEKWSDNPLPQWYARNLQQALWLFEHDITRAVYMRTIRVVFDTHSNNTELQTIHGREMFEMLGRLLDELEHKQLGGLPAAQQLVLVASSELGRYPRLNSNAGKDHLPEAPVIMYGAGLSPGQFVDTGRQTEALPVDLKTGRYMKGGHTVTLDDIGATVLELAGINYSRYAHTGTPLPFCLAK